MRNANNVGVPNGGLGVSARIAGVRHRPRHARHRRAGAAVRGRREPRLQHVHDGRDDHRRESDEQHVECQRHRLEGSRQAHAEARRPVSVRAGAPRSERHVQRHVHVRRDRDRYRLRGFPARRSEQLHPVVRRDLPPPEQVRRVVRAGQLARALEPDGELRPALGPDGAVVRDGQRDSDDRPRPAVGRLPEAPRGLVFPGDAGVARGLSPARWGNFSPRVGVAYAPNDKTSVRAQLRNFLHRVSGTVGRHHVRRPAVRL